MNPLLIKLLAVGLTVSQVFTRPPEQIQTKFDPAADQAKVAAIIHDGCAFAAKETKADGNFKQLIELALATAEMVKKTPKPDPGTKPSANGPTPAPGSTTVTTEKMSTGSLLADLDFDSLRAIFNQLCFDEKVENSPLKLDEVIAFYNAAMADLPDFHKLKGLKLAETSTVLDRKGKRYTDIYAKANRRTYIPIAEIPQHVKQAFLAAEDQRFAQHIGVDLHGIMRAFQSSLQAAGRPQGGSTITQQVIKNLLAGDDLTFERKMREMVLAVQVEGTYGGQKFMAKDEILELYLNQIYLGCASWGIETAAQSYFGKSARELKPFEAAFLAGLTQGPNYHSPEKYPERALKRYTYVIGRMKEDGFISEADATAYLAKAEKDPKEFVRKEMGVIRCEQPKSFYIVDEIQHDVRKKIEEYNQKNGKALALDAGSFTIRSTVHPELQKAAETALQDGLAEYERQSGRSTFQGPVGSIKADIEKYDSDWQHQIATARIKMHDVQWPLAVYLGTKLQTSKGEVYTVKQPIVGLADGRTARLTGLPANAKLEVYDLIFVNVQGEGRNLVATVRNPPLVQGAIVVLEAKTGRVLALSGGFSFGASELNRVTETFRQPGSTLKPFVYLSALNLNYQPNTQIPNTSITLPPLERGAKAWTPKNYDGAGGGLVTIRRAIERSLNLPTVRLMATMTPSPNGGDDPTRALDYIRQITHEIGIYQNPARLYPFVLGAQPVRLLDMAVAYATIANIAAPIAGNCPMCLKPVPQFVQSIEQNGQMIYDRPLESAEFTSRQSVASLDRVSIYQMRRILEGTVARGTAVSLKEFAGKIAGKTGTSNNENDAWFMGFTNDLVVGVWVGYDNNNIRPNLGSKFTGASVALPIASKVFRKSFEVYRPAEELAPMPADVAQLAVEKTIDLGTGEFGGTFKEVFRKSRSGGPMIAQRALLRGGDEARGYDDSDEDDDERNNDFLSEGEDIGPDRQIAPRPRYVPGAQDPSDLWGDRRVDRDYYRPPFFRN